ncbi:MAG: hypothetical protein Q7R40_15610 [Phaeospirillum sp.]|nr:hypothetical protein [Phaeospirillum sp.]
MADGGFDPERGSVKIAPEGEIETGEKALKREAGNRQHREQQPSRRHAVVNPGQGYRP